MAHHRLWMTPVRIVIPRERDTPAARPGAPAVRLAFGSWNGEGLRLPAATRPLIQPPFYCRSFTAAEDSLLRSFAGFG